MRFREFVNSSGLGSPDAMAQSPETNKGVIGASGDHHSKHTTVHHKGARVLNASIQEVGYERAYEAMKTACAYILSDEQATVQNWSDEENKLGDSVPIGQLFVMGRNSPSRGMIEIEYKPQQGKSFLGDVGFTMGWLFKKKTNFLRLPFEKMGIATNPEAVFRNSFEQELLRLTSQPDLGSSPVLNGLEDWTVTTSTMGRNIIVKPKSGVKREWAYYGEAHDPVLSLYNKLAHHENRTAHKRRGDDDRHEIPASFISWPQIANYFQLTPEEVQAAQQSKAFVDDGFGNIKVHPRAMILLKNMIMNKPKHVLDM